QAGAGVFELAVDLGGPDDLGSAGLSPRGALGPEQVQEQVPDAPAAVHDGLARGVDASEEEVLRSLDGVGHQDTGGSWVPNRVKLGAQADYRHPIRRRASARPEGGARSRASRDAGSRDRDELPA